MKRKLLMVGRMRYSLPLSSSLEEKFEALSNELDIRVLASVGEHRGSDPRFQLVRNVRPRVLDDSVSSMPRALATARAFTSVTVSLRIA